MDFKFEFQKNNDIWALSITGADNGGMQKSLQYQLADSSHAAHLNFHESLSRNFGTRTPSNRQAVAPSSFSADYCAVLTENISPDVLYGYGDPSVIRVAESKSATGWGYYLIATSNDAPNSFPILRSEDLKSWNLEGFAFPQGQKPAWVKDGENVSDFWAPEVHKVGDKFILCFTAREQDGTLAIGLAESDHPAGPFESGDASILTGGVIDAHIFVEKNGTPYLFWKEDNNDIWPALLVSMLKAQPECIPTLFPDQADQNTALFMAAAYPMIKDMEPMERFQMLQPLIEAVTDDFIGFKSRLSSLTGFVNQRVIGDIAQAMQTPFHMQQLDPEKLALVGERHTVIENDQDWEGHLIEGMYVVQADRYYLFYSGNDFATDKYGIGVASSDNLKGPYVKQPGQFLKSTGEWSGPGHPSVVLDIDNNPTLVMHGFVPGTGGYKVFRALLTAPLILAEGKADLGRLKVNPAVTPLEAPRSGLSGF